MTAELDVSARSTIRRQTLALDAGIKLADTPETKIAAEIFRPAGSLTDPPIVFICLPGGSINRGYYDLGAEAQPRFSFARYMAEAGMITVSIDHLGVGESTRPADGFALTPDVIAEANAHATRQIVSGLRGGGLISDLPPLPKLESIGVGHSMGAMLTVIQQARWPSHDGLVLLGFSNNGLIEHLPKPAHALIGHPETIPARIGDIARQIYPSPYPELAPSPEGSAMFYGSMAERDGVQALKAARDVLLAVSGLQSMVPGSIRPRANAIAVPIFLGLGDQDIAGSPHAIPATFPNSRDISLLVLPETGHCQFIFPSRELLFARIAAWAGTIVDGVGG
ncbi:MAG TPA: alpha/beta hydrolase [Alphaproteobacteria bacterium]|nr:alpha/beta hydrolase [Alphaproteobacteria bacterium]